MTDERRVEVAAEALWRAGAYRTRNEAGDAARAVVAALDAHDGDVRHPNGLRYVNPRGDGPSEAERHPSTVQLATWRDTPRCPHGAASGTCALCRNGIDPTTGDVA